MHEKLADAMQPDQRIVTQLPLGELWDEQGSLPSKWLRTIGRETVADLLRFGLMTFVVADCGSPLRWVLPDDVDQFWKHKAKPHVVEPDEVETGFQPGDYPESYCFVASEWKVGETDTVVLLEQHH